MEFQQEQRRHLIELRGWWLQRMAKGNRPLQEKLVPFWQGNFGRVLIMTFSEFGRRVAENASGGTDHGAASSLFVIGDKIKPGLLGTTPGLAPADLTEGGDMKYTVDFRSVYSAVLEQWLKTKSEPILGRKFPPLAIV